MPSTTSMGTLSNQKPSTNVTANTGMSSKVMAPHGPSAGKSLPVYKLETYAMTFPFQNITVKFAIKFLS